MDGKGSQLARVVCEARHRIRPRPPTLLRSSAHVARVIPVAQCPLTRRDDGHQRLIHYEAKGGGAEVRRHRLPVPLGHVRLVVEQSEDEGVDLGVHQRLWHVCGGAGSTTMHRRT